MRKVFITTIILAGLVLLLTPEVFPDNFLPENIINDVTNSDVVIIFNSGGWGNTPFEKAEDFAPIIEGIQETLGEWGYNSIVIPYNRTKDSFTGKVTGAREFLNSFNVSSENLAESIEMLKAKLPDKKIIMAGLSNGATFVDETYEKISVEVKESVYAISVGAPFWAGEVKADSDNILQLKVSSDSLAKGDISALAISALKAPFKWLLAKFAGYNLSFAQMLHAAGHDYSWSSPEVNSQIVAFLERNFR